MQLKPHKTLDNVNLLWQVQICSSTTILQQQYKFVKETTNIF
jgi:hypothetical protein